MKISKLIESLTAVRLTHGDLEVTVLDLDELAGGNWIETPACLGLGFADTDRVKNVLLCDDETAYALYGDK